MTETELADALNAIADDKASPQRDTVDTAIEALLTGGGEVRAAAAARALAFVSPERARAILPSYIDKEPNRFVGAIMKGALRAAHVE